MIFESPFVGPEAECHNSVRVSLKAVRDWKNRAYEEHWGPVLRLKQGKCFLQGLSVNRTGELLKRNRNQVTWMAGILTEDWRCFKFLKVNYHM
jgi:hypothetical protein